MATERKKVEFVGLIIGQRVVSTIGPIRRRGTLLMIVYNASDCEPRFIVELDPVRADDKRRIATVRVYFRKGLRPLNGAPGR